MQADFDNYRKRNANVYADALSDGKAEAIKAFLPVIDNIDRAIASCKEQNAVLEGLKLVRKQADEALKKLGVEEVGAEGEAFDPNLHNAVVQEPAQDDHRGADEGLSHRRENASLYDGQGGGMTKPACGSFHINENQSRIFFQEALLWEKLSV